MFNNNNNNQPSNGGGAAPAPPVIKSKKPQPNVALKKMANGEYDYGVPLKLSNFFYR